MLCPYCVSEIDDRALACPHCARDLYLFSPLLQRIARLEQAQADNARHEAADAARRQLEERVAALEQRLASATVAAAATADAATQTESAIGAAATQGSDTPAPGSVALAFLTHLGIPLAALLVAHALITIVYDGPTLYLRIVSLLVPLPFGFGLVRALRSRARRLTSWVVLAGFMLGIVAALGMSTVIHFVDRVPVLPQSMRDWRELIEYAASIGFGFCTGMLVHAAFARRDSGAPGQAPGLFERLAALADRGQANAEKLEALADRIRGMATTAGALATSGAAAYTGLRAVVGQ